MRSIRHWGFRYFSSLIKNKKFELFNKNKPWITHTIINQLETLLKTTDTGLECGSGRSSIWFAERTKKVISIEHNKEWFEIVKNMLKDHALQKKINLHLTKSSDETNNAEYINIINKLKNNSLDYCLVDGIIRDECALAAIPKLKAGGLLIIDDIERYIPRDPKSHAPAARSAAEGYPTTTWKKVGTKIKNWRYIWVSNGVTDTGIWFKPDKS